MMIGNVVFQVPLNDLSTTAFWRIRPRILAVPGVANVSIWGQRDTAVCRCCSTEARGLRPA